MFREDQGFAALIRDLAPCCEASEVAYGSEYEGGGVADPRPEMLGASVRLSIASPRGSLAMLEGGAAVCSPIIVRPKNTSGEVHAATARRMWFVRNERPTWYAAKDAIWVSPGWGGRKERRRTVHPAKPFAGYHLEIDALIAVFGINEVRESDRVELFGYNTIKVDERSRHPVRHSTRSVKTDAEVGKNRHV
jgi:hypothetical protein